MNITVVGTGYVGLVVGGCLAETGNTVTCADVDAPKIDGLKKNVLPIYEPGLDDYVERNQRQGRLTFTTDIPAAIASADVVFIAVGTPPDEDGSADLRHVLDVAASIGKHMTRELVIVTKSTVPVGTAAKVAETVTKHARFPFHMCSNPEFLKEGAAIDDFMKPDRVVIGVETDHGRSVMAELYAPFVRTGKPILFMDLPSAEMTKYAANAMLATRISFMNEIANLCEITGADVDQVRKGIGSDGRIGPAFLFPGPGYGGSCFPKDVKAFIAIAKQLGTPFKLLEEVESINARMLTRFIDKVRSALWVLKDKKIAVWGMTFKPDTDDVRNSVAIDLINILVAEGAHVTAYDPKGAEKAVEWKLIDPARVKLAKTPLEAAAGAEALILATEWKEFQNQDFAAVKTAMHTPLIFDGRNLFNPDTMREFGFDYRAVGRAGAK